MMTRSLQSQHLESKINQKNPHQVSLDTSKFQLIFQIAIDNEPLSRRKEMANFALNMTGGLEVICRILDILVAELDACDRD